MKVFVCLALLCIVGALAAKENHLKYNKTPKKIVQFTNVCDECEDIVKRFAEAVKDPAKLATLKELLMMMCSETKHTSECRIIVSKLDLFIHELLPYLKDADQICHRFHMCSNSKIDQFHRVGLLYAKKFLGEVDGARDLICEECQFAAHELQQVIDNTKTQDDIRKFLSTKVCAKLGQYRGSCDIVVDDFLPDLFQQLHSLLQDAKQFCYDLKLCTRQQVGLDFQPQLNENTKFLNGRHRLAHFKKHIHEMSSVHHPELAMSCLECKILIDGILIELRTENSVKDIAEDLTNILCNLVHNEGFNVSCRDFVGMYGPTVVNMSLYQFTSKSVCVGMHACPSAAAFQRMEQRLENTAVSKRRLACEACNTMSKFIDRELSNADIRSELIHGLTDHFCNAVPSATRNLCENLALGYLPLALTKFEQLIGNGAVCRDIHACHQTL